MCVLIVGFDAKPEDKLIDMSEDQNPHGGGMAWRKDGIIHFIKGISGKEIKKQLQKVSSPVIVHFRIATAGGVCEELTHPFPVNADASLELSGTANAVIAHNGVLPNWEERVLQNLSPTNVLPKGRWSDTRAMAWLANMHGPDIFHILNEKVAYFSGSELNIYKQESWVKYTQKDGSYVITSNDVLEMQKMHDDWFRSQEEFVSSNGTRYAIQGGGGMKVTNRNDQYRKQHERGNMTHHQVVQTLNGELIEPDDDDVDYNEEN